MSCTGHGIKIKFPQMYSGTIVCLYQAAFWNMFFENTRT